MRRTRALGAALALLVPLWVHAGPAGAAGGAWRTYLHPYTYRQLLALTDTVWCATGEGGLLRYDVPSAEFTQITRVPGELSSNDVTALALDRSGRLWVGTADAGLSRLDADGGAWTQLSAFDGVPGNDITVLEADGDSMWIGTTTGIALWNGTEIAGSLPEGVNPSPFASDDMRGIARVGDSLWIATGAGPYVSQLSTGLAAWSHPVTNLATTDTRGLAWDGGSLFTLAGGRAYRFDFAGAQWVLIGGIGVVEQLTDAYGVILAATDLGIYRWEAGAWAAVPGAPVSGTSGGAVLAVTQDPSGRVWAANQNGLRGQGPAPPWPLQVPPVPPGNNYTNLALDGTRLYVTTAAEGVGRLDANGWRDWYTGRCTAGCDTTFLNSIYTYGLLVDRGHRKWTGCWETAVESFDDDGPVPQFTHYWDTQMPDSAAHTRIAVGVVDSVGGRWFGMDTPSIGSVVPIGLEYYRPNGAYGRNWQPTNTPNMLGGKIKALTVDHTDLLWIGYSGQGIATFDYPRDSTATITQLKGTDGLDVQSLEAHGDEIWALTTEGLIRISRTNTTLRDTLPILGAAQNIANDPLAVAPDGTVYTGSSTDGMRVFKPDGEIVDYTRATTPLADDDVRAISVDPVTGYVWIGTGNGLNRFDPSFVELPNPPLPSLTIRVWPNPAVLTGAGVVLRIAGGAARYDGAVYDLSGRVVRRFSSLRDGAVVWDGRDQDGGLVRPGIYFVLARAGGRRAVARVALLR